MIVYSSRYFDGGRLEKAPPTLEVLPGHIGGVKPTGEASAAAAAALARELPALGLSPDDPLYTNSTAAKYYARGIVINLGLDLDVNPTGMSSLRRESYTVLQNLSTVFAGARVETVPIQAQTTMTQVATYTFALPDDRHLLAVWNDGIATDENPGISTTLRLPGFAGQTAIGIDPLHSLIQPLVTEDEGQALVIRNLQVKDYPLLVQVSPLRRVYLPLVIRQ